MDSREVSEVVPDFGHYGGWNGLCQAVFSGSMHVVQREARDLSGGEYLNISDPVALAAADRLGASLGFLQVASGRDDLSLGLARAAAACGTCHGALKVTPPTDRRPVWEHQQALHWAVFSLVWNQTQPPPEVENDEILSGFSAVFMNPSDRRGDTGRPRELGAEDRLDGLLNRCWECHTEQ